MSIPTVSVRGFGLIDIFEVILFVRRFHFSCRTRCFFCICLVEQLCKKALKPSADEKAMMIDEIK